MILDPLDAKHKSQTVKALVPNIPRMKWKHHWSSASLGSDLRLAITCIASVVVLSFPDLAMT